MRAGLLRHKVTFQRSTTVNDAFGEPDRTWRDISTEYAQVVAITGAERFSSNQVQTDVDHRIVTRNTSALNGLQPKDRATWDGRVFDIRAVIPKGNRRTELEILVQEHL